MLRTGEDFTDPPHASNPSAGGFGYMETFTYPVPHPAPRARGQPAGQRWDGEKMITYKGWNWRCVVASGFGSLEFAGRNKSPARCDQLAAPCMLP